MRPIYTISERNGNSGSGKYEKTILENRYFIIDGSISPSPRHQKRATLKYKLSQYLARLEFKIRLGLSKIWYVQSRRMDVFQNVSMGDMKNFNPYRDLQFGGTLLTFRNKQRWISDKCVLGWFLKNIYD